jgi:glycosyltransferase involved in cell wall biosynthesis
MRRGMRISVVIPCFNEAEGIARVVPAIPAFVDEIIIVDNNSTDDTSEVARRLGAKVVFEGRRGYGSAYKAGLSAAAGDITVTMDGDGTYPVEQIGECIDYLLDNNLDFVSASRFPLEDAHAMNIANRVGNALLTMATLVLFMRAIRDSQSGMWIFRTALYRELNPMSDGMPFSEEIKIKALMNRRVRFGECHIGYHQRIGEVKLQKWRDGVRNLLYLVKLRFGVGG